MDSSLSGEKHHQEEEVPVFPASGTEPPGDPASPGPADPAESEAEILRKELSLFQSELDAIQERVAAIQRESSTLAATLRRQGEEQARAIVMQAEHEAQQIIQRAVAKAELVELRARVRAEETRARSVARLWSRMEESRGRIVGGRRFTVGESEDQQLAELLKLELKETDEPADSYQESLTEISPAGETPLDAEALEPASAEPGATRPEPHEPVERRYRVGDRLSFASMMSMEDTIRSFPCVAAASVTPLSGGGTLLSVVSTDPDGLARRLAETPGLPAFQETT